MMLKVSSSPHIRDQATTSRIMLDVCIALIPALLVAVYVFGYRALILTAVTVASCVFFEWLSQRVMKRPSTIHDFSAVVTGLLLAFNFPASLPLWMAVLGALIAIVVVKQCFGGLGDNFANPAITARVILIVSFPAQMTHFVIANRFVESARDASYHLVSSATTLSLINRGDSYPSYLDQFLGFKPGCIGEVSAIALLLGGAYLLIRRVIDPSIPLSFILTTVGFVALTGQDPLSHLLSGGLLLGAIFMATDYVTSPITLKGKIIFGIGCGLLTGLIRIYSNSTEGVSFAILLMNILTPHINRWTRQKPIGGRAHVKS